MLSKLIIKTQEWSHRRYSGVFTVNFEHTSHLVLVFLLLTLNKQVFAGRFFIDKVVKQYLKFSDLFNV